MATLSSQLLRLLFVGLDGNIIVVVRLPLEINHSIMADGPLGKQYVLFTN